MANLTTKLELSLPLQAESYNIDILNANFTAIDNYAVEQDNTNSAIDSRIKGQVLKEATNIVDNTDLNTIKSAGMYVCPTDASATTLLNYPSGASRKAFALVVVGVGSSSHQTIYISDNTIYSRQIYATGSSAWKKISDSSDMATKVDKIDGKGLSTQDYTTAEKTKLAGVAEGANNYTHPNTHPATIIIEDNTHRFMTDSEKTKLGEITPNANNYTHPTTHSASIITTDPNRRFLSDTERSLWNSKASGDHNHDTVYAKHGDITIVKKQTKVGLNLTLFPENWILQPSGQYRINISNANITVQSIVNVSIHQEYLDTSLNAGVVPVTVSYTGGFYMFSGIKPTEAIVIDYVASMEV